MSCSRAVTRRIASVSVLEGGGFPVRRPFPTAQLREVDPFLLLDHMGPVDWPPGEAIGAPDHPHRGFETVTYLLQGSMQHRDSFGHQGKLGPGDVQWMTAGSGIVHSELPEAEFKKAGGVLEGFQLWVNLPAADKMKSPHYQEIPKAEIPEVLEPQALIRVIAGEVAGQAGAVQTHSPVTYLHVVVQPQGKTSVPVPVEYPLYGYVSSGQGKIGDQGWDGELGDFFFFGLGETLELQAGEEPLSILLLGAEPLNEPIARHGPFVMNTQSELVQAFEDFQTGKMGVIS